MTTSDYGAGIRGIVAVLNPNNGRKQCVQLYFMMVMVMKMTKLSAQLVVDKTPPLRHSDRSLGMVTMMLLNIFTRRRQIVIL